LHKRNKFSKYFNIILKFIFNTFFCIGSSGGLLASSRSFALRFLASLSISRSISDCLKFKAPPSLKSKNG